METQSEKVFEKGIKVYTANMARHLLKMGYTIIDIKPHDYSKLMTMFIFRNENNIEGAINYLREQLKKDKNN